MNRPPNFNGLARLYRWMEFLTFGPWLALTRRTFLGQCANARHALVLGDGDGRFTASLLGVNPTIAIDAVDASAAMLHALVRRAGPNATRVAVHLADARTWHPPPPILGRPYDLVATHFFLDCLSPQDVEALAGKLHRAVSPSGLWLVSDFAVPPGWFGRLVAGPLVAGLYFAFGLLTGLAIRTLPDHGPALRGAGFTLLERRRRLGGLLIAELWSAVAPGAGLQ